MALFSYSGFKNRLYLQNIYDSCKYSSKHNGLCPLIKKNRESIIKSRKKSGQKFKCRIFHKAHFQTCDFTPDFTPDFFLKHTHNLQKTLMFLYFNIFRLTKENYPCRIKNDDLEETNFFLP